jgi:uncharacterized membrane protein YeiH
MSTAGTQKAVVFEMRPFVAILLGTITGLGGGTVRIVLLAQVPSVLQADVYATAALAGSAVMIAGCKVRVPRERAADFSGTVCFLLRVNSVWQHWNLPRVRG